MSSVASAKAWHCAAPSRPRISGYPGVCMAHSPGAPIVHSRTLACPVSSIRPSNPRIRLYLASSRSSAGRWNSTNSCNSMIDPHGSASSPPPEYSCERVGHRLAAGGGIGRAAEIAGAQLLFGQHFLDRFDDGCCGFALAEMLEHHRARPDLADRIGDVLPG